MIFYNVERMILVQSNITVKHKYDNANDYGERWFSDDASFENDMEYVWGKKWGLCSEVGRLKAVLLRRPGEEIEQITDFAKWRWGGVIDPIKAREQHDRVAEIYKNEGAEVFYVENQREDKPNAMFMRDNILATPEGAIVCRQALRVRRGEESAVSSALGRIGCPIVRTISGNGYFEGACALWVDRETIILGSGVRANFEGVRQVEEVLRPMGVSNILHFQIPYGHAHLDGLMSFVDRDKMLIFPWQTPYDVIKPLMDRGIKVLEAPSIDEVKHHSAMNLVTLAPGKVLMPTGTPLTRKLLEDNGVEVVEVEIGEIRKGFGALHCLTAAIAREED